MTATFDHWINGRPTPTRGGGVQTTRSPADGAEIATIAMGTAGDIDTAVSAAVSAASAWRRQKPIERGRLLMALAAAIRSSAAELAALEAAETGKPD